MAFTRNDEAVSPVIGVILMVAVTVILAAVIAAFVFGMAGGLSKGKTVAISAKRTSDTAGTVTNMGGPDVGSLQSIAITGDISGAPVSLDKAVGATATITPSGTSHSRVIATGTFTDGKVVLLDTYI